MHKWNKQDQSVDAPTHVITGAELGPTPTKVLTSVQVKKLNAGYVLVFWGATGIATSPLDAGSPALGDASNVEPSRDAGDESSTGEGGGVAGGSGGAPGAAGGGSGPGGSSNGGATGGSAKPSDVPAAPSESSGCSCSVRHSGSGWSASSWLVAAWALTRRRRRWRDQVKPDRGPVQ